MNEPDYGGATALINCKKKWEESWNLSNPLMRLAKSMMLLEDPKKEWTRSEVLRGIGERIDSVDLGYLGGIESMLACQTYALHQLFAIALEKYATCQPDKSMEYSELALKSQELCRKTAATISFMKVSDIARQKAGWNTSLPLPTDKNARPQEPKVDSFKEWSVYQKMCLEETR